jgi:exodeoxyribonuclease VII small subunit
VAERKTNPKRPPARSLSFGEAVAEVESILAGLEQDAVDIDRLGSEVARAVELIQICREKLAKTDREVRDLVAGLQAVPGSEGAADGDEAGEDA